MISSIKWNSVRKFNHPKLAKRLDWWLEPNWLHSVSAWKTANPSSTLTWWGIGLPVFTRPLKQMICPNSYRDSTDKSLNLSTSIRQYVNYSLHQQKGFNFIKKPSECQKKINLCAKKKYFLMASHILGSQNALADNLSRNNPFAVE